MCSYVYSLHILKRSTIFMICNCFPFSFARRIKETDTTCTWPIRLVWSKHFAVSSSSWNIWMADRSWWSIQQAKSSSQVSVMSIWCALFGYERFIMPCEGIIKIALCVVLQVQSELWEVKGCHITVTPLRKETYSSSLKFSSQRTNGSAQRNSRWV